MRRDNEKGSQRREKEIRDIGKAPGSNRSMGESVQEGEAIDIFGKYEK
jgi:hypothetical protein